MTRKGNLARVKYTWKGAELMGDKVRDRKRLGEEGGTHRETNSGTEMEESTKNLDVKLNTKK